MIKMSINRFLFFLVLLFTFASCDRKYKIEGTSSITSLDGRMLYLKTLQGGRWTNVDSAEVVHGLFSMSGLLDSAMMVTLFMDDEGIMPLVLEHGKTEVSISLSQLSAKGTPYNETLYEFIDKRNAFEVQLEDLESKEARMVLDGANLADVHQQLADENAKVMKEMNDYIKGFIIDNYDNVLGPNVFMMLCSTLPYPVMTPQIEEILKDVPASFKSNRLVKDFITKAKDNMQLIDEHRRMEQSIASRQ